MITKTNDAILARMTVSLADAAKEPPAEIMVFPAGTHTIHASQAGRPVAKTVVVGPEAAAAMNAALKAHLEAGEHRPYFDFDHDDTKASAWPLGFRWESGTSGQRAGVYAKVDWSASGAAAVIGKDYRSFSPAFHIDESGRVNGAPLNMGGLVNAPAFRAQAPIWAKDQPSAVSPTNQNPDTTMTPEEEKKAAEAAAAAAEAQKKEAEEAEKKKAEEAAAAEAVQAKARHDVLSQEVQALKAKEAARVQADATAKVEAAVARGALPAKDTAIKAKWVGLIAANPANAELLEKLPGRDVTNIVTSPAGHIEAKAGLVEELRGYQSTKSPRERAVIYAKHIAPEFKAGGFSLGPILAANSLGTLAGDLVVQRALSLLKLSYPWLFKITTDFSDENAAFGQTIRTRLKGPLVANPFVAGEGYGSNNATTTDVPITINQHIGVPVTFNVNELGSTTRDLFGEQAEGMHAALGDAVANYVLALITPTNFTHYTESPLATFGRPVMTAMARKLGQRKVSSIGRFTLLNPEFFEKLGQDNTLVQLAAYQKPEYIEEYRLPRIAGFQPYEAVSLPTDNALAGFSGTAESLALATRVPNDYTKALPGAAHGNVSEVLNPDTGITVQKVEFVDHNKAEATSRVALMFGAAKGNPATGERLVEVGGES